MDQGNRGNRSAALTEAHIRDVDQRFVSPGERADYIWQLLRAEHPELTDWDVICFAVEYLGMMSRVHLWLEDAAKKAAGLVYAAHYMNAENIDANSGLKRPPAPPDDKPKDREEGVNTSGERKGDSDGIVRTRFFTG